MKKFLILIICLIFFGFSYGKPAGKGRTIIFLTGGGGGGGTIFQRLEHNFFYLLLEQAIFSQILVRQKIYFFNFLKSNNIFSFMGYSLIYGIKGNLSNLKPSFNNQY